MDRALMERHLAMAERHIALGERIIGKQREIICELERNGHDFFQARAFLSAFEELQALHIAEHDQAMKELGATVR
ncbi:MAG: hypothetical protein ACR650_04190 [Methylocystis sp.]